MKLSLPLRHGLFHAAHACVQALRAEASFLKGTELTLLFKTPQKGLAGADSKRHVPGLAVLSIRSP